MTGAIKRQGQKLPFSTRDEHPPSQEKPEDDVRVPRIWRDDDPPPLVRSLAEALVADPE